MIAPANPPERCLFLFGPWNGRRLLGPQPPRPIHVAGLALDEPIETLYYPYRLATERTLWTLYVADPFTVDDAVRALLDAY